MPGMDMESLARQMVSPGEKGPAEPAEAPGMGEQAAAEEAIVAIKQGDSAALAAALKNFVQLCMMEHGGMGGEGGGEMGMMGMGKKGQ